MFISTLKEAMRASMAACGQAISRNKSGSTKVKTHRGEPRWQFPDLGKLKVPENLRALHTEIAARWGIIDLLDFLKESDFVTDFTDAFTTVATREATPREVIRKRLLLVLYALGTNVGIKRVADGGRHGETEAALRATRHLFVNRDNLRAAIATLVNATLRMRDPLWWGNGTACASDSKKFGSWSSNLMTEYHARYGGPGVMIYWHVDRTSVCVNSQLRSCNASEVAAMMEGVLRHCTDATIDRQYTDSHGQSLVGFAFSYLLGFKLLPRMKNIARQKLVKADADDQVPSCLTGMVADKPIDWEIIAQQYDQMVKYATALRLGTAEAEQVLRRFTRGDPKHPAERMVAKAERRLAAVTTAQQARLDDHARRAGQERQAGRRGANGRPPVPLENKTVVLRQRARLAKAIAHLERARNPRPLPSPTARACLTDPDSRLMLNKRGGYCQGYNIQIASARRQLLLAVRVLL
ncbi:Tn3 family transposase [Nonomuraea angiospora]|uniref:Tn3 family transposase n=1 Tax=Nonomuraea angiospora TaxID=46172 RepID=UPI0033C06A16